MKSGLGAGWRDPKARHVDLRQARSVGDACRPIGLVFMGVYGVVTEIVTWVTKWITGLLGAHVEDAIEARKFSLVRDGRYVGSRCHRPRRRRRLVLSGRSRRSRLWSGR